MKNILGRLGYLFLAFSAIILVQGCSELNELRTANRRQAITIRDQMSELDKLRMELESVNKTNLAYQDRARSDGGIKESLRVDLYNLAVSIGNGAVVRDTIEGLVVQLPEKTLFDSGLAKLKPDGETVLMKVAEYLNANPTTLVRVDGHTDNEPINKSKYLWESNHHLSAGRALSVLHFLVSKGKIEGNRIHIAGYGPNRPASSYDDNTGKNQNSRVDLLIFSLKK